jgi:uncharacterized protein (DUF58 family)
MERDDLISEIRKIEIASRRSSPFSLSGNYRSVLKGAGLEIEGFKEYSTDDDYRAIDWNVTARSGRLHTRIYREEREIPLFFIVDTSYSMYTGGSFGGKRKTKIETSAVVMAVLAYSASFNNDKAGSVFCSDILEKEQNLGGKSAHIADMVFSLLDHIPVKPVFDLKYALSCIPSELKKGCCIVISDFKSPISSGDLYAAGKKTDLIFIRVTDPSDTFKEGNFSFTASCINSFPVKQIKERFVSLSGPGKKGLAEESESFLSDQKAIILKGGVSFMDISTEDNIPALINDYFLKRRK